LLLSENWLGAAREFALGEFPDRAQEFDREEKFDLDIRWGGTLVLKQLV
jgi:hypothetical protein